MKIKMNNHNIFMCPEGRFSAILEAAESPNKRINRPCAEQVRLRFRVTAPDGAEYLVGKTYCADLGWGTEFYNDLEGWIDGNFEDYINEAGEIDLDMFLHKKADLVITHFKDGKHEKPFVKIAGIFPEGKLTQP